MRVRNWLRKAEAVGRSLNEVNDTTRLFQPELCVYLNDMDVPMASIIAFKAGIGRRRSNLGPESPTMCEMIWLLRLFSVQKATDSPVPRKTPTQGSFLRNLSYLSSNPILLQLSFIGGSNTESAQKLRQGDLAIEL